MTEATEDPEIAVLAGLLGLTIEPAWLPAVRANLDVTLRFAKLVEEFPLPDESEPANVYRA